MKILCAIFIVICVGQPAVYGVDSDMAVVKHQICTTCECKPKEKFLDCTKLNLFKLFDDSAWATIAAGNNSIALTNVEFDDNGIQVVTAFPTLDIRSLSFHNNQIRKIEYRAFRNLTLLEKLDLSENRLTSVALQKEVFEGFYDSIRYEPLKNLKWLNLANNDIHAINADVFDHLENLEVLFLSHNPFKIIDPNSASAISMLNRLQVLDLGYMELRTLPEHMLHAPRDLKTLNLTGNIFTEIPKAIHFASNLVNLNLDDNPMEQIGGDQNSFPFLPKLETLSISYMHKLESIDEGAFHQLPALRHFNCRYNNHLSTIHPHAFGNLDNETHKHEDWPPLQSLILYNNNLSSISQKLLERWDEIEEFDLRFNPWRCTCENQWMVDKLIPLIKEKSKTNPIYYEDIKCEHPDPMNGKSFSQLNAQNEQMRCDDYYGRRPDRDGPILVGVFIGLMIGIPITMGALFVYRRGCFGIFGYRPSPSDYGRAFYKRTELREDLHM